MDIMSFSFGFESDDIEDDEKDLQQEECNDLSLNNAETTTKPKRWTLTQLLTSLPSQMSYNTLNIPASSLSPAQQIPRRSLFDIRAQLMAEANPEENENDKLIEGLDTGDLSSGEYEGGFKTWECAVDLAAYLAGEIDVGQGRWWIIELGAGSAMPSLSVLQKVLNLAEAGSEERDSEMGGRKSGERVSFTLCDYNEDVLRLCTAPNVLLTSHLCKHNEGRESSRGSDQDLDLEEALPDGGASVENDLARLGVAVDFISGPWGKDFVDLLLTNCPSGENVSLNILLLASETLYAPDSLLNFTEVILTLLAGKRSQSLGSGVRKALVAAKKIYFGVGGGTDEFERCLRLRSGHSREMWKSREGGVGRIILEVTCDG
jgi:protein-histidine N-methyltransferase